MINTLVISLYLYFPHKIQAIHIEGTCMYALIIYIYAFIYTHNSNTLSLFPAHNPCNPYLRIIMYTLIYIYACMYNIYIYMYIYACMYTHNPRAIHISESCMHALIYIYIYYTYIYIYIYIYMHVCILTIAALYLCFPHTTQVIHI